MWRLLPNELYNKAFLYFSPRRLFLLQIIGFVFSVHMSFVAVAFFMGWWCNGKNNFTISLHEQAATYVLMPLQKTVHIPKDKKTASVKSHKKSNIINYDSYLNKKNASQKKNITSSLANKKQTHKKVVSVKSVPHTKLSQSKVPVVSMVLQAPKSEKFLKGKKKKGSKVKIQTLPEQVVSQQIKQNDLNLEHIQEQQATQQQIVSEVVTPQQIIPELSESELDVQMDTIATQEDEDLDLDNVVFIGNQDLDERLLGQKVQQLVVQHWTPPAGIVPGASCKIRVKIDKNGQGIDAQVVKGSGVFMYDRSLRQATLVEGYPQELCGKTISFTFEE